MVDPRGADGRFWLFGYGSLIWRPDIPFDARTAAVLPAHARRFWQGSHDHRGLPHAPGRVVTLIDDPDGRCHGVAYRVPAAEAEAVLARLDHREKNGYERRSVRLHAPEAEGGEIDALVYLARPDNFAWLGPAPLAHMVRQIAASRGPSGSNREYLLELAAALRELGADDPHVFELEAHVLQLAV